MTIWEITLSFVTFFMLAARNRHTNSNAIQNKLKPF